MLGDAEDEDEEEEEEDLVRRVHRRARARMVVVRGREGALRADRAADGAQRAKPLDVGKGKRTRTRAPVLGANGRR
jgi:hypothetical protein